jgi:hypothetical protein
VATVSCISQKAGPPSSRRCSDENDVLEFLKDSGFNATIQCEGLDPRLLNHERRAFQHVAFYSMSRVFDGTFSMLEIY